MDVELKLLALAPQLLQRAAVRLAEAQAVLDDGAGGDRVARLGTAERVAHDIAGSANLVGLSTLGDAARRLEAQIVAARRDHVGDPADDLASISQALWALRAMVADAGRCG